jgi:ribosome-associated toxin RatA of RatAB toxin-antitoxin module
MAQAEFHEVLTADRDRLYQAVTQYDRYPDFVDGCISAESQTLEPGKTRVKYRVSVMSQDVQYTVDHTEIPEKGMVKWELVESNFFKKNSGSWEIKAAAGTGKSDVKYILEVEFKIPVPGFILNKLIKGSLPGMVKSFAKHANQAI